jgi:hypothetical protein
MSLDPAQGRSEATLPVVISDTEAVYLYGLDILAQQQAGLAWSCTWVLAMHK